MKLVKTLFVVGLLLAAAPAVFAAQPAQPATTPAAAPQVATQGQALQAPLLGATPIATLAGNCGATATQALAAGLPTPTPTFTQTCGSCSSTGCQGATRGQLCWLGGVNGGWGNCNIYSGGFRCSTGGWECQCGTGPLP